MSKKIKRIVLADPENIATPYKKTVPACESCKSLAEGLKILQGSNFLRALIIIIFSISFPDTYRARSKRETAAYAAYDAELAQKEILREFGPSACILEEPCRVHASRPGRFGAQQHPAWNEILRNYRVQSTGMKQWYLLSLYIGDAVRDVPLCRHLAKRMPCPGVGPLPPPQPR
ncbi:uncharacterized protein LOC118740077 [Rhagoletis pomonella]|uniref:uncharacterized protein LOC118740077 n=1 Tax=Rhagoletis pomonella TaxID=28610 RepID=UPI00177F3B04|nr:uncharacterized protein LOC118740077 [Rhagoletis pomonella]